MLNLRHINPMVRAVGTMGAVSALVGGITFAQMTSNTVALSNNQLSTASAHLKIGLVSDTSGGGSGTAPGTTTNAPDQTTTPSTCDNAKNGSVQGFDLTGSKGLAPGGTSDPLNFCLENTGGLPLDLTAAIPQAAFADDQGIMPSDVTLAITCDNSGAASDTLDQFDGTNALGSLAPGASTDCQATLMLSSDFSNTSNTKETLPSFDIQFVGTESSGTGTSGTGTGTGTGTGDSGSSGTSGSTTGTGGTGGTDGTGTDTGTGTTGSDQSSTQSQG